MKNYYSDRLSSERLKRVYEIATPRINQYLDAELNYVIQNLHPDDLVIELGCGYGRVLPKISAKVKFAVGIDISLSSLILGGKMFPDIQNCFFSQMNAVKLAFQDHTFDAVVCIQNGISAFHINQKDLIRECIRITKPKGTVFFSSYSEKIWKHRLEWFQMQSDAGLLGEIDYEKTIDGNIVCKDGFSATTMNEDKFNQLTSDIKNINVITEEVDESSIFFRVLC